VDPGDGVTAGINHTLRALGLPEQATPSLLRFIGPPTEQIFAEVLHTNDGPTIARARDIFSEFYRTEGFARNRLYAETAPLLDALAADGHFMTIVTSKASSGAIKVADLFNLHRWMRGIFGRVNDCSKIDSLTAALATTDIRPAAMVGDRSFDVAAARACGCIAIAVTWGYGTMEELRAAAPDHIVHTRDELVDLLTEKSPGFTRADQALTT
jgi:phosphoglycolate phosphatase